MSQILLKVKNVQKTYFSRKKIGKEVLSNITFDLLKGEIFSLLGVNGAGKTTLSSIIATLHPLTKGELFWNNKLVYDNLVEYRKTIGFCPQHQNLDVDLTLEQNLIFQGRYYGIPEKELKKRTEYLLDRFDLKAYAKSTADILSGAH